MKAMICSECGTDENVKPARDYAELAGLFEVWRVSDEVDSVMLCPNCASTVYGERIPDPVSILPLDFLEPGDPDIEL